MFLTLIRTLKKDLNGSRFNLAQSANLECLHWTCKGQQVSTYYDEFSNLLHSDLEHILMTHDDMDEAMEVLVQGMARPAW